MLRLNYEPFPKLQLSYISSLVLILFLLTHSSRGQSQDAGPSQTIVTLVGKDVTLPCHLDPPLDIASKSLEWGRLDLDPRFVHVWHQGQNIVVNQNPSYKGRTSVSTEKLKHGDLSLELSEVKHSDNGIYRCYVPSQDKESTVQLVVGSVSSPVMADLHLNSSSVVLQCESAGWYPEPEVLWLDGEGKLLSAGPTETVRGPDDLYTVSSRVTVEKRHSNSFTCRVHQKDTNHTTETHIQISADCFEATTSSAARVSVLVVAFLIFILAAAFVVWKWRRNQTKETKIPHQAEPGQREREQLIADSKELEDLKEKHAKLEQAVKTLMEEQKEELQEQRNKINQQKESMEKNIKDIEYKVESVEKMEESERYMKLRDIILTAKKHLVHRKQGDEDLDMSASKVLTKTNSLLNELNNDKEKTDEQMEIKKQKDDSDQIEET
ncbi:butyrophilin subfamily 3 member A2-like isoform X1 [Centropristis striata]|uniref:butyrophilin subfamily 3 member A2-like isoform X1 n=1 Tax=Centropristis striata TaxID=184440 RepID=UPI0027E03DA8|nr:butyrophilin subfamily 3 member A2-like isoform X1 [Centropristis striata]XP_059210240.1 butyrophilin subfamily 3 member A2-like isoform X1 [Centropristis striata]